MRATTSEQALAAIKQIKAERGGAARASQEDDVAVLDEELYEARLALLELQWKETNDARKF